jgi:hypothetical protein
MRFIAYRPFQRQLKQRYQPRSGCYFYDAFDQLAQYDLHGRLSWRRVASTSESAAKLLRAKPPFVLFTDRLAGWRQAPNGRRRSPIRCDSIAEALGVIRERSYFRDRTSYADNYYLCDRSLLWFMTFCHHDGWHLWLPTKAAASPLWRRWQVDTGAAITRARALKDA